MPTTSGSGFSSPAAGRAGVDQGVRVYDLRHTACSFALRHGVDPVAVANMSGHSVAVLRNTYAHYVEEAGRRAAEHLDAVIRESQDTAGEVELRAQKRPPSLRGGAMSLVRSLRRLAGRALTVARSERTHDVKHPL